LDAFDFFPFYAQAVSGGFNSALKRDALSMSKFVETLQKIKP